MFFKHKSSTLQNIPKSPHNMLFLSKQNDKIFEHTYQISKYFVGHNLKINADYGYINEEQTTAGADDKQTRTFRIQAQLKF